MNIDVIKTLVHNMQKSVHLIGQLTFPIFEQFSLYLDNGITIPNDGTILEVKLFPAGLYFTGN